MSERIRPEDTRKPDPQEPYRYACPDCGGEVWGRRESTNYYCPDCGAFEPDELTDRKWSDK